MNEKEILKELNFYKQAKSISKDSRSVRNRIQSIIEDSSFVKDVSEAYGIPLVANERCGRWYIIPGDIKESVYFKSTDGHVNQWGFSTRRLNLHLIDFIVQNNGCIVVDSTRRGKRIPDALSKTIPIWCAVLNQAVFGIQDDNEANVGLFTSPSAVSKSEHDQIEQKIPSFLESFAKTGFDIDLLKKKLNKPLKPLWVTSSDGILPLEKPEFPDFYPVVLCTASKMVQDGTEKRYGYTYVQGAADDHEEWADKLNPSLLWDNVSILGNKDLTDAELLDIIDELSNSKKLQSGVDHVGNALDTSKIGNTNMWVGKPLCECIDTESVKSFDLIINMSSSKIPDPAKGSNQANYNQVLPAGKKGSKTLRTLLPDIEKFFSTSVSSKCQVLVLCETGNDFSIGVVLALLSLYYNENNGSLLDFKAQNFMKPNQSKDSIRRRLVYIINSRKCNPSRATLNSVNSFLMG
ncbi:initiator tRNA phosphoribosyl transferase [Nadsonia fulvescens var. elongata DSM 6958]|uniref:Initiator tRNA phosphoribosyl transferase n=1 Tax=Nadsonia fulvescens var. elongata DSM 6958 TaxID=857566 RepID=A0A1E3PRE6_9ASCO|nr:initiator tRNA phosphoribosyl transferase [Nadsonia fulvescens var. elongata DSM 6958]